MDNQTVIYIICIALLTVMSAYFSATETAFSSLNKTRLKTLAEKGSPKAELAYKLSEKYDKLISTILIGNNIVNIAAASIGTVMFVRIYGDIGATISTAVVTVIILIFGEISPKSLAKDSPERFAMFSASLINLLIYLFTPLNYIFSYWKKLISKLLRVEKESKMSQEELLMFVDEVEQEGSIDTDESILLKNVIEFNDCKVKDIATHRVDIEAVSVDADKAEIAALFTETKFSRLLVYEENLDSIVGVIHQKDFYIGTGITEQSITEIMTEPVFVLKSEKVSDLLTLLQKQKSHIAVLVDEYGGTYGLVTLEDILEELVGEIWDEHDEVIDEFKKVNETTYSIDGTSNLDEFCELFEIEEEFDHHSVSGWIMDELGRIPSVGDSFQYRNLTITVSEMDTHRIAKILVVVSPLDENLTDQEKENDGDTAKEKVTAKNKREKTSAKNS